MTTLKQMLNEQGYKKYSAVNPLLLQSKVIKIVNDWLQQNQLNKSVAYNRDHLRGKQEMLKELLEELEGAKQT